MDAAKIFLFPFLNGNRRYIIPVYQRIYSWDSEQCRRLWYDIIDMQKNNKYSHFIGSIVNILEANLPTGNQTYMIIDGQQRITTLILLLTALRDYIKSHPGNTSVNADKINNTLLKNPYEENDEQYKLSLTKTDNEVLISLIENKPVKDNLSSRLIDNYKFFIEQISQMDISLSELYEAIGKLQIVNIILERDKDDPQAIFESLNSTGKELSESDLIRNHILMGLDTKKQNRIYENIWHPMEQLFKYENQTVLMDRFFRDYLTMKTAKIPKISKTYEEFKIYHNNSEFSSIEDLCNDLYLYAKYFTDIVFCYSNNTKIVSLYKDINSLKMEVAFPFLLKVHNDFNKKIITENEFIEIIQLCITYVFRRSICDIPTNSLNKTFATLKNEIKTNDYLNSIKAFFILRENYKIFPDDSKFITSFMSKDIYNMRSRNFLLSHLENFNNKAPIIIENYTIEHIMPQNNNLSSDWKKSLGSNYKTVQKKYLHTIGNLTLTAYNSEMSDKDFLEKMNMPGGFKESALRLNSFVIKQSIWNEEKIVERASLLADLAIKIWAYPKLEKTVLCRYRIKLPKSANYSIDSYEFNNITRNLFKKLDTRIMNLSSDVKREFKKLYIAYKLDTNFVDIVVQKNRLRLSVNMKFKEVIDEFKICRDITNLGRWGNGDVEVFLENDNDIDKVMSVIKQSYQKQLE